MSCHAIFLFCTQLVLLLEVGRAFTDVYELQNEPTIIKLGPNSKVQLFATAIPSSSSYVICQIHTLKQNVTLSENRNISAESSVTGRNIGILTTILSTQQVNVSWYLMSQHDDNVSALVYVTYLTGDDPVPGGCNLEFNLENDPNIHVKYDSYLTTIEFQWANIGYPRGGIVPDCDAEFFQGRLEYELYVNYLTENSLSEKTYFSGLRNVHNAGSVIQNGRKLKSMKNDQKTQPKVSFGSYVGQGAIYSIVVKQNGGSQGVTMATYVPMVTYSCDLNHKDESCVGTGVIWKIFAIIGGIAGLFLCFVGHRFFKIELFMAGFLAVMLISYIVLSLFTSLSTTVLAVLSAVFGLVGGALWVMFWYACGFNVLSVLLFGLVGGYIISSIIFFSPFD